MFQACSCLGAFALTVVPAESGLAPDIHKAYSLISFQDLHKCVPIRGAHLVHFVRFVTLPLLLPLLLPL